MAKETKTPKAAKPKPAKPKVKKSKAPKPAAVETAQLLSSVVTFECSLFKVRHDKLIEPGGKHSERDVIRHNGSVVILALDTSKSKKNPWVVIERQYRHAANQYLWELPAGKLEPGEPPLDTARRELAEEAGVSARDWHSLEYVWSSPGVFAERLYLFLATGLAAVSAAHERSEVIEIHWIPLQQACQWALDGTIADCKTAIGLLRARRFRAARHAAGE